MQRSKRIKYNANLSIDFVYIGRGPNAKFGNPFSAKSSRFNVIVVGSSVEAIRRYKLWLEDENCVLPGWNKPTREEIKELTGKILACHCEIDKPCHGDVLIFLSELWNTEDHW